MASELSLGVRTKLLVASQVFTFSVELLGIVIIVLTAQSIVGLQQPQYSTLSVLGRVGEFNQTDDVDCESFKETGGTGNDFSIYGNIFPYYVPSRYPNATSFVDTSTIKDFQQFFDVVRTVERVDIPTSTLMIEIPFKKFENTIEWYSLENVSTTHTYRLVDLFQWAKGKGYIQITDEPGYDSTAYYWYIDRGSTLAVSLTKNPIPTNAGDIVKLETDKWKRGFVKCYQRVLINSAYLASSQYVFDRAIVNLSYLYIAFYIAKMLSRVVLYGDERLVTMDVVKIRPQPSTTSITFKE